ALPSEVESSSFSATAEPGVTLQVDQPLSVLQPLNLSSALPVPLPPPLGFSMEALVTSVSQLSVPLTPPIVAVMASGLPLAVIVVLAPSLSSSDSHSLGEPSLAHLLSLYLPPPCL